MCGDETGEVVGLHLDFEAIWLTQAQIAEPFSNYTTNVTLNLKAVFAEGELTRTTCKDCLQVRLEGKS